MNYKDIKSFGIACKVLKRKPVLPNLTMLPKPLQKYYTDHYKLTTIISAMNKVEGDWKPDYKEGNKQPKYFAWPRVKSDDKRKGGFALSRASYGYVLANSLVGSRLLMGSSDMVYWALDKHTKLYITHAHTT